MPLLQSRSACNSPFPPFPDFPASESVPAPAAGRVGSTILLVDDDPAVLEALRRVLQSEGWEIVAAACGEEALEYLQDHRPNLMITDLSMAAVSGWDLLFHENLQRPDLPLFVITALPLASAGGAERFADAFFPKPVDIDALLAAVRRHLGAPDGPGAWSPDSADGIRTDCRRPRDGRAGRDGSG